MNNYLKYRDQMDCFDVLCCEHNNWIYKFIGHTAVIFKNNAGQLMVFESTSLNKFSGIKGVQLTPLGLWLQHYNGKVWWRKWVWDKSVLLGGRIYPTESDIRYDFQQFIKKYRGTSYPSGHEGAWLLFKAWWDSAIFKNLSRNSATDTVIFCSHLVGKLFKTVGFFEIEKSVMPQSELIPGDFREGKYIDGILDSSMGHLATGILIRG